MTEDIKSSTLVSESNRLYEALNTYNNVYVPKVNQLLQAFGLTEPIAIAQIEVLDTKTLGKLLEQIALFLSIIGKEIGGRTYEDTILGAGYAGMTEAYADVPNRFTGETATAIQKNMAKTGETVALLDGLVSSDLLYDLLSKIVAIKNKVAEVTPFMARV